MSQYRFSLIVATYNRRDELIPLLDSLVTSREKNFELIIVDQNPTQLLEGLLSQYADKLNLRHFKVPFNGVSRARNYGIAEANGRILAFPDDDCTYSVDLLRNVAEFFDKHPQYSFLSVGLYDFENLLRTPREAFVITATQIPPSEITFFFDTERVPKGAFLYDLDFGINGSFCSAEGWEQVMRLIKQGYPGYYEPAFSIHHAPPNWHLHPDKHRKYAYGSGACIRKHFDWLYLPIYYYVFRKLLIAPLFKVAIAIATLNRKKNLMAELRLYAAVYQGFFSYRPHSETSPT